jgi:AraC-like DNA-binding protein
MKAIEYRLPQEFDKSFIVFEEKGKFFPCPLHYHPEYELVLVNKSTGVRMVGDHIGYFDEGDLVFIGAAVPHVWINDTEYINGQADTPAEAIVIHFVEDFLGESFFDVPEMQALKDFLMLSKYGIVIKGNTRERINSLMKQMLNMTGIQRLAALFTIFDILCSSSEYQLLASPGYLNPNEFDLSDRFSKINDYIMRNFDHDITLKEIASVANMAVSTFCNFFKEHYRVTFVEYLNNLRVGHACKALSEQEKNVFEIAYKCGFNNLANFNRQFKKIKKMTPSEFRKTTSMLHVQCQAIFSSFWMIVSIWTGYLSLIDSNEVESIEILKCVVGLV